MKPLARLYRNESNGETLFDCPQCHKPCSFDAANSMCVYTCSHCYLELRYGGVPFLEFLEMTLRRIQAGRAD